jgi:hypothetical protein
MSCCAGLRTANVPLWNGNVKRCCLTWLTKPGRRLGLCPVIRGRLGDVPMLSRVPAGALA